MRSKLNNEMGENILLKKKEHEEEKSNIWKWERKGSVIIGEEVRIV